MHSIQDLINLPDKEKEFIDRQLRKELEGLRIVYDIREAEEEKRVLSEVLDILKEIENKDSSSPAKFCGVAEFITRGITPVWELVRILRHYATAHPGIALKDVSLADLTAFIQCYGWVGNRGMETLTKMALNAAVVGSSNPPEQAGEWFGLYLKVLRVKFKSSEDFSGDAEILFKIETLLDDTEQKIRSFVGVLSDKQPK